MSKKDVELYYEEICNQRQELINEIHDFELEAEKGLIEPERLDLIKENIQPLMQNYERISYIMFLLNKPVNKKKHAKYLSQNKKFLKALNPDNSTQATINENDIVVKKVKSLI